MDLYSEQDVISKIVVPTLASLGYDESKKKSNGVLLRFEHPITVQQGREKKTIFADVVVFVHDAPVIVVDGKNPREYLTERDREQTISYARLLPNIAPYAALCNGGWQVFDSVTKQQIKSLPTYKELVRDIQRRRLTTNQRASLVSQATRTLFAIESVRDLSRLMQRCHDIIRNLKGYDPTKAFDELSKILFAKMYEEREILEGRRKDNRFTLSSVKTMRQNGVEIIQTLWSDTIKSDRYREVFADDPSEVGIELPPEAIDKIVGLLEDKSLGLTDLDVKGVAFEEFLSATYRGGGLGQYFTPREIVRFMVDLADPAIGDRIVDPSCGTGGFLIRTYDVVSEKIRASDLSKREKDTRLDELANQCLVGVDWETRAARTCKMNMIIHGDGHAGVYQGNALDMNDLREKVERRKKFYPKAPAIEEGEFDIVLTNPPFGARDDVEAILKAFEKTGPQKREVLLLEQQIRLLRPGGRLCVVLPEGILSNKNDARIRRHILDNCIVKAIIRMPQDAFKMSEGAACTSILYAVKKNPDDSKLTDQGDIFFARAEFIGITPSGKPIPENDLLAIRDQYRQLEEASWKGIEMKASSDDRMVMVRAQPAGEQRLWLEPKVNRTSLLYDRLSYVVRSPQIADRFSYTFNHPSYYRVMDILDTMPVEVLPLSALCVEGYPVRGRTPDEESTEGIPILKVRNVTGNGINLDTEYAPDNETTRSRCDRALLSKGDVLITSTGEGTIGRVDIYPYDGSAIADGHVSIVRLRSEINLRYVVEFLRSEYGQIQMLRYVSGSTGQTELLLDHIKLLRIPMPMSDIQNDVVEKMEAARYRVTDLTKQATQLVAEGDTLLAVARAEMVKILTGEEESRRGGRPQKLVKLPSTDFAKNLDALLAVPHTPKKKPRKK